jgi:MFS transporter, DHA2 family, multidrug resistance protein
VTSITGSKLWITVGVMCAALMAVLDISIVNVGLSDIRASFGTPLDQIAWVSTGYMMANIVVIPMTGWLQRRFGFKRYFAVSILMFTASSALCGLAWNLPSLVLFRVLQGCGGGAIIPTSQAILFARYPRNEHGMAGALFGLGAVTGPLLGPTLGGWLIEVSTWHWMFLINVPVGLTAAALVYRHVEEPGFVPDQRPIDRFGFGLLLIGMASLQYVLEEGNRDGWTDSPTIVALFGVSVIALVTLVVHVLETKDPIVDLRIFLNRSYAAATGINFILGISLFSGTFLYSLYCGTVMHYQAFDIGILFLKGSIIQLPIMILIGRFSSRFDGRKLVAFGIFGNVVSLWLNAHLGPQADEMTMLGPIFARSLSLGFIFVPMSVIALSDVLPQQRGNAAGLFNLTRELGGSIGTAWMSTSLDRRLHFHSAILREHVDAYNPIAQEQLRAMRGITAGTFDAPRGALGILDMRVIQQALVRAFNEDFMVITFVFAAALGLVLLLKRPSGGGPAPAGAH